MLRGKNFATGSAGPILSEIAARVSKIAGPGAGDAFLYAEADDGWVAPSVFKDLPESIAYRGLEDDTLCAEISDQILNLWYAAPPDQKWNALIMTVSGNTFDARFQYAEGWDESEDEADRCNRMVKAKFGDKPITYPTDPL
jgi:hypothetical protein